MTTPSAPPTATPAAPEPEFGAELEQSFSAPAAEPPKLEEPAAPAAPEPEVESSPASPLESVVAALSGEPEAKGEEKPAEKAEDEPIPAGMDQKAGATWKALRGENKELARKLAEREQKILELEQRTASAAEEPQSAAELATLKERLAERERILQEMNSELAVSRVEATPEYRASIEGPRKQLLERVGGLAKKYEVKPELLVAAVQADDTAALSELLGGFSEKDRMAIYGAQDRLSELTEKAKFLREHASQAAELLAKRKQEQEEKLREEFAERARGAATKVWKTLRESNPVLKETGNPEWDGEIREIEGFVAGLDFAKLDADGLYAMAYQGAVYPRVMRVLSQIAKENQELKGRVKAIASATPEAGGAPTTPSAPEEFVPFGAGIEKAFGGKNIVG